MPLVQGSSKKAFSKNVKAEMKAGKPQDQSLAIAYDIKRKNSRKKMADGGKVTDKKKPMIAEALDEDTRKQMSDKPLIIDVYEPKKESQRLAFGGEAEEIEEPSMSKRNPDDKYSDGGESEGHYDSVASAIMSKKRRAKKFSEGGEVDIDENAMEEPNHADDLSFEALKKENYSEDAGLEHMDSPMDSNEHGDELSDADEHDKAESVRSDISYEDRMADDMIGAIRRRMKARRG